MHELGEVFSEFPLMAVLALQVHLPQVSLLLHKELVEELGVC
jgi:hypothetical protein